MEGEEVAPTVLTVSRIEMWAIRGVGMILLALIGWVGSEIRRAGEKLEHAVLSIATIQKELELTAPADVKTEVGKVARDIGHLEAEIAKVASSAVTKEDVSTIVFQVAPWGKERDDWIRWRSSLDARLDSIDRRLQELGK